jgi:hypothetical protein
VHVASLCFECSRCFMSMLQEFCAHVVKLDLDVAYVAIVLHTCCKSLFEMFHKIFQIHIIFFKVSRTYVAFLCVPYKCFICMLNMFQMLLLTCKILDLYRHVAVCSTYLDPPAAAVCTEYSASTWGREWGLWACLVYVGLVCLFHMSLVNVPCNINRMLWHVFFLSSSK